MYEELSKAWSADAAGYDETVKRQLNSPREVAHWKKEFQNLLPDAPCDVLEVGCGPGFLSILLAQMGHRVTAVDGAEEMVARAARNFQHADIQIKNLYCSDAVVLPREAAAGYDIILSRDVVWTLYDPKKAYARWQQLLRPGGLLLVYDGNYRRDQNTLKVNLWRQFSKVLKRITDGRSSSPNEHHTAHVFEMLPFVKVERPQADYEILASAGYTLIDVQNDAYRNSKRRLNYWKYGYQGKKFRIAARCPIPVD